MHFSPAAILYLATVYKRCHCSVTDDGTAPVTGKRVPVRKLCCCVACQPCSAKITACVMSPTEACRVSGHWRCNLNSLHDQEVAAALLVRDCYCLLSVVYCAASACHQVRKYANCYCAVFACQRPHNQAKVHSHASTSEKQQHGSALQWHCMLQECVHQTGLHAQPNSTASCSSGCIAAVLGLWRTKMPRQLMVMYCLVLTNSSNRCNNDEQCRIVALQCVPVLAGTCSTPMVQQLEHDRARHDHCNCEPCANSNPCCKYYRQPQLAAQQTPSLQCRQSNALHHPPTAGLMQ